MSHNETKNASTALPKGYAAIPINQDEKKASLKICVLVRSKADPVGGHLILLHDRIDTKVYLGCIVDVAGQVHDWLELWIQSNQGLLNTPIAHRQPFSNLALDNRWIRQFQGLAQLGQETIVRTGWESKHPLPTLLDPSSSSTVNPVEADSQSPLELCTDDGLLTQKQLPTYSGSAHCYLYVPALGAESPFAPVTPEAPTNEFTKPLSELCGDQAHQVPLNLGAGLIMARKHLPIGLEPFIDNLSGAPWDGLRHGKSELNLGFQTDVLKGKNGVLAGNGRLFLESRGKSGRLAETFYLKLGLLSDIVSSVQLLVSHLQRPLLNISADSFRIKLAQPGCSLPFLWTAKAELTDPGDAISLAIEKSDVSYYLSASAGAASVYRPLDASLPAKGQASIRITEISAGVDQTTIVKGTFATQERIRLVKHDLVWLRLGHAAGTVNLYARLEKDSAMAPGEWRFHTVAQDMREPDVANLQAAKGVPMSGTPFEVVPLLSSPCDLYSLAVLAVRMLLVDNTNSLPRALDAVLSLARKVETTHDASVELNDRIKNIFAADNRWLNVLGPHHLTLDKIASDEAATLFPITLWWAALAMIVRMFPGLGPDSICRDYGDASQRGLHKVFDRTIAELQGLMLRTRSLIVPDWGSNYEIAATIQRYLEKHPKIRLDQPKQE